MKRRDDSPSPVADRPEETDDELFVLLPDGQETIDESSWDTLSRDALARELRPEEMEEELVRVEAIRELEEDESLTGVEDAIDEELAVELALALSLRLGRIGRAVGVLAAALLSLLLVVGWSYYVLPPVRRSFHHYHEILRPSGLIGLSLGILGVLVMFASLLYLVRKHFVSLARWGRLQTWLRFHVFAGLLGAVLVLFHAAFVPASALGLFALVALLVVVASGIVGRYVFVYCPKTLEGHEIEFAVVRKRLAVYKKKLLKLGVDAASLHIDSPASPGGRAPWLVQAAIGLLYGDRESRREFARLRDKAASSEHLRAQMDRILPLVRRLCRERQWLVRYQELHKLMGAWRFFHRWLAIVLLFAILFHIGIAVGFGDLWILGGLD